MLPFTERVLVDRSRIIPVVLDRSLDILIDFLTNFRIILAVYNDTFKICAVDWFPCEHELPILSRRRHGVQTFFYELGTP